MTPLRIVLVDDHPILVAGLKAVLEAIPDVSLVGEAATGAGALELVRVKQPDLAIIDISLPDMTGVALASQLALDSPSVRLLALTAHEDSAYVQAMLAAGARGYLLKRSASDELARAIRAVADGGTYLDPAIAGLALSRGQVRNGLEPSGTALSAREEDVLCGIARGLSNKEIGARLEISTKTVETYKARATEKLGLHTRADIVRHGATQGWLLDFGSESS